jgi:hypothetical protein
MSKEGNEITREGWYKKTANMSYNSGRQGISISIVYVDGGKVSLIDKWITLKENMKDW